MLVKEIMKKAMAIDKDMTLEEASRLLSSKKISSLIIMKNHKIYGIITEEDIIKNYGNKSKIFDIMHKNVISVSINTELKDAVSLIKSKKISILPVVDKGNLVGVISANDLLGKYDDSGDFLFD